MLFTRSFILIFSLLVTLASAADSVQPDPNGCVDPAGLKQCVDQEDADFVTCGTQCNQTTATRNYNDCLASCDNFRTSAFLGCQVQSCWNHVSIAIQVYVCQRRHVANPVFELGIRVRISTLGTKTD
jgi:hypothetical protein